MENPNKCRFTGKTRYPDPGAAKQAILQIKTTKRFYNHIQQKRVNRRAGKADQCRTYYCKDCHGWHMTSKEKTISAKRFVRERIQDTQNMILTDEQAKNWKKDSIPFPENTNPQNYE